MYQLIVIIYIESLPICLLNFVTSLIITHQINPSSTPYIQRPFPYKVLFDVNSLFQRVGWVLFPLQEKCDYWEQQRPAEGQWAHQHEARRVGAQRVVEEAHGEGAHQRGHREHEHAELEA